MERKIGEIFKFGGEWYQCMKGNTCNDCAFYRSSCGSLNDKGSCRYNFRGDATNVIFKKLEKVGEPYMTGNKLIQRYKIYPTTYHINVYGWYYHNLDVESWTIDVEIKQNNKDMENKKDNYDGNMDKECIQICDALNSISDVRTTESCCGHCKDRFMVFFTCDNPHSLAIIARVFDRRYIGTSQPWYIELQTKDSGAYDYFIHSETKYDSEEVMMKDINQIIENIKYWCNDKFASHFKGCDNKPTLTQFDINLAKQGKSVRTRDGRKARIICFDRKDNTPIVALIERVDGIEILQCYHNDGKCFHDETSNNDLMMLPEKKEGWIIVSKNATIYDSLKDAKKSFDSDKELCICKIEWEE